MYTSAEDPLTSYHALSSWLISSKPSLLSVACVRYFVTEVRNITKAIFSFACREGKRGFANAEPGLRCWARASMLSSILFPDCFEHFSMISLHRFECVLGCVSFKFILWFDELYVFHPFGGSAWSRLQQLPSVTSHPVLWLQVPAYPELLFGLEAFQKVFEHLVPRWWRCFGRLLNLSKVESSQSKWVLGEGRVLGVPACFHAWLAHHHACSITVEHTLSNSPLSCFLSGLWWVWLKN